MLEESSRNLKTILHQSQNSDVPEGHRSLVILLCRCELSTSRFRILQGTSGDCFASYLVQPAILVSTWLFAQAFSNTSNTSWSWKPNASPAVPAVDGMSHHFLPGSSPLFSEEVSLHNFFEVSGPDLFTVSVPSYSTNRSFWKTESYRSEYHVCIYKASVRAM